MENPPPAVANTATDAVPNTVPDAVAVHGDDAPVPPPVIDDDAAMLRFFRTQSLHSLGSLVC